MQIKTTVRYYYTPISMALKNNSNNKIRTTSMLGRVGRNGAVIMKSSLAAFSFFFFKQTKHAIAI